MKKLPLSPLAVDHPNSFAGRALVIHAREDEGARKQPAGNSGAPIACAVIAAK
jgi:Cu/Zn superoxide dismutase